MRDLEPMMTLVQRARYEAQNNQMIDGNYLEAGKLLNELADRIEALEKWLAQQPKPGL